MIYKSGNNTYAKVNKLVYKSNHRITLPDTYRELAYIEGTGTQYIDTGIVVANLNYISAKFQLTDTTSNYTIYGAYYNENRFGISAFDGYFKYNNTPSGWTSTGVEVDSKIHTASINLETNIGSIDNQNTFTITQMVSRSFPQTIGLLAYNSTGWENIAHARLYSFRTLGSDTNHTYIPAKRISDGKVGMYDIETDTFHTSSSNTDFIAGPDKEYNAIKLLKYKYDGIPSDYHPVEYIESSGTQYINTGLTLDYSKQYSLQMDIAVNQLGTRQALFSNFQSSESTAIWCEITTASAFRYGWSTRDVFYYTIALNTRYNVQFNHNNSINNIVVNGVSSDDYSDARTTTAILSLLLFRDYRTGVFSNKYKCYGSKIYVDNVLVRDFVPCIHYTGALPIEAGLYDKVNGVFYGNSGTGSFTTGPEIEYGFKTIRG